MNFQSMQTASTSAIQNVSISKPVQLEVSPAPVQTAETVIIPNEIKLPITDFAQNPIMN